MAKITQIPGLFEEECRELRSFFGHEMLVEGLVDWIWELLGSNAEIIPELFGGNFSHS